MLQVGKMTINLNVCIIFRLANFALIKCDSVSSPEWSKCNPAVSCSSSNQSRSCVLTTSSIMIHVFARGWYDSCFALMDLADSSFFGGERFLFSFVVCFRVLVSLRTCCLSGLANCISLASPWLDSCSFPRPTAVIHLCDCCLEDGGVQKCHSLNAPRDSKA